MLRVCVYKKYFFDCNNFFSYMCLLATADMLQREYKWRAQQNVSPCLIYEFKDIQIQVNRPNILR